MSYPTPAHDPACRDQLAAAVQALYRRARSVLGEQCEATPDYTTSWLSLVLTAQVAEEGGEQMATMGAYQVIKDLMNPEQVADPAWWGTPLGRAVCWWVSWPGDPSASVRLVPPPVVRHVLGISRQAAFQRGGVWSDELRRALRERWPAIQDSQRLTAVTR